MKILFIYKYAILGGVTTQLVNRLYGFKKDFVCHFTFLYNYGGLSAFKDYEFVSVLKNKEQLKEMINKYNYDVISVIDTNEVYDWLKYADFKGIVINEVHTTTLNIKKIKNLKEDLPMDIIMTPSQYMKNLIETEYGFKDIVKVLVIPNCLDVTKFKCLKENSNVGPNKILWIGKLDNHKRWEDFLEICKILNENYDGYNLEYILVGGVTAEKEVTDKLIDKIIEYNLIDKFTWYSTIEYSNMFKIYSDVKESGGVYVSTAINESFGMTVLESMAIGLPVVVPKVGALPELFTGAKEEIKNDSLYDLGDLSKACDLIIKRLNETPDYDIDRYTKDNASKRYLEIIKEYKNNLQ